MRRTFTGVFEKGSDGFWVASCLEVPGALTQGQTLPEARSMLKDAIQMMIASEAEEQHISDPGKLVEDITVMV